MKAASMDPELPPKFLKQYDISHLCLAFLSFKENLRPFFVKGRLDLGPKSGTSESERSPGSANTGYNQPIPW